MKNKRGVSGVVTAVLLILLAVASIGVLWVVVSKLVSDNAEVIGAGINNVNIDVQEAHINNSHVYVKIKRMPATGNLTGVKFIFEDSDGDSASVIQAVSLKELEVKTLSIDYSAIEGVDFSKVIKISALPVVGTIGKNERVGSLGGEYVVKKGFVSDAGLVLYLPLDGSVEDKSEKKFDVTNVGATSVAGQVGGGYSFDGVNDYLNVEDSEGQTFNEFTLSAWIYKDDTISNYKRVLGKYRYMGGNPDGFYIYVGEVNSDLVACRIEQTSGNGAETFTLNSVPKIQWVHVVCTYDGSQITGYVNGVINSPPSSYTLGILLNDYPIRIGATGNSEIPESSFKGDLDEVRVYNRALSAEEVSYLYQDK